MQHQRNPNNVYFIYERRSRPLKSSAERSPTSRTLLTSAEGSSSSDDLLTTAERSPWSNFAERLPPEMSVRIFSELDAQSLVSAALTCRLWNRLVQEVDVLWKRPCLSVRTFCQREVDRDRTDGLSWKVTLVRNYQRSFLKRDWLRGRYSNVMSADELRDRKWCPLDLETWGEILEAELER